MRTYSCSGQSAKVKTFPIIYGYEAGLGKNKGNCGMGFNGEEFSWFVFYSGCFLCFQPNW